MQDLREMIIQTLGEPIRFTIPPDYLDVNGHMSIRWYMALFEEAWYPYFARFGFTEAFYAEHGAAGFDLEHHLRYLREVHQGDSVAVFVRMVARSAKRIHGMMFMVNETQGSLAASFEFLSVYVDLKTRRSAPYPEVISQKLDVMLALHQGLAWDAPLCGVMKI